MLGEARRGPTARCFHLSRADPLGLLLAACGTDNSAETVEIQETNDPLVVDVIIDTCNADVDVDVTESDSNVEFDVQRNDSDGALSATDDCQDLVRITLDDPIGTRPTTRPDDTSIPFVEVDVDEP